MSGRYENEMKIDVFVKEKLEFMPAIMTDYYYSLLGAGKSYTTAKEYIKKIAGFIEFMYGDKCKEDFYCDINSNHINKYIASLRTKHNNGKTQRTSDSHKTLSWSALNSFFKFLVPNYISVNPVSQTERPKMKDNPEVTYLTLEEIEKLLQYVEDNASEKEKNRDLCILRLGIATGLRISAIVQIDVNDIDFENNIIKVTEKGDHDYYIMVGDKLKMQILLWLEDRQKYFKCENDGALFLSKLNQRINVRTVEILMKKYAEKVTDKKVTPHVMRHSCATNLYEQTGDIYLCAKQLNHKNVSTTQRYAELSKEKQKKAANILDGMI